jgi:hypothetical protein
MMLSSNMRRTGKHHSPKERNVRAYLKNPYIVILNGAKRSEESIFHIKHGCFAESTPLKAGLSMTSTIVSK